MILTNCSIIANDGQLEKVTIKISKGIIQDISPCCKGERGTLDLEGELVVPGLIDMQVHLREPGFEHKETIETGLTAAVKGGFTTVGAMPNTKPVLDSGELYQWAVSRAQSVGLARLLPIPAITKGMKGEEIAPYHEYKKNGCVGITDDGKGVQSDSVMEKAFIAAKKEGLVLAQHCEFNHLSSHGAFHDGDRAKSLGVKGISSASEYEMVRRDIDLVRKTGASYHVLHVSTKEAVELVRLAKKEGLPVTCEVTPHHLVLCDEDISEASGNYKMNPPLRSREDMRSLLEGLQDGTIDMIATDHAPHTEEEKRAEIHQAPFGITGLETAFPLLYTKLVKTQLITLKRLVELMTSEPARVYKLPYGTLNVGRSADLAVINLNESVIINRDFFLSKGKNSPFFGEVLFGIPSKTFFEGRLVWER